MPVVPLEIEANLKKAEGWIERAAASGSDLVIFPELWSTGFNYPKNVGLVDAHESVWERLGQWAKLHSIWLSGTILAKSESGKPVNRAYLYDSHGRLVAHYDKIHLFSLQREHRYLEAGNEIVLVDTAIGKIGFTTCYDVRFPELWRRLALEGAEMVICPAGFPDPRLEHWQTLLRARAIENQYFVLGVNTCGTQTLGSIELSYFGHSTCIDPWGEVQVVADRSPGLTTAEVNLDQVAEVRSKLKVFADRRVELY